MYLLATLGELEQIESSGTEEYLLTNHFKSGGQIANEIWLVNLIWFCRHMVPLRGHEGGIFVTYVRVTGKEAAMRRLKQK